MEEHHKYEYFRYKKLESMVILYKLPKYKYSVIANWAIKKWYNLERAFISIKKSWLNAWKTLCLKLKIIL